MASATDGDRDVDPAAYGGYDTIKAFVVIAREHRGGVQSGAGAIEEDHILISIAKGVVATNVEQLLDHTRALATHVLRAPPMHLVIIMPMASIA